jgi:4-diphosphocytidyl-2-C-methyl-D-erythritol kinase
MQIAASLGADVPFFLFGGRALGIGRGDEIYPLPDVPKFALLVVSPKDIHVPTPDAYRWLKAPALTKTRSASKLWKFCSLCWSLPAEPGAQEIGLYNDFERPVFQRHPQLAQIKRALLQRGATEASLAGSGSAVFGVFPSPALARRAAVGFQDEQTFVCESISRDRYLRKVQSAP